MNVPEHCGQPAILTCICMRIKLPRLNVNFDQLSIADAVSINAEQDNWMQHSTVDLNLAFLNAMNCRQAEYTVATCVHMALLELKPGPRANYTLYSGCAHIE